MPITRNTFEDKDAQWEVREKTANAIETLIKQLKTQQAEDTDKSWLRKRLT